MPKEKVKSPNDKVKIYIAKTDVFEQLGQQFVVYQINGKTYKVPVGVMSTVSRKLAEVALNAGDITEITE